MQLPTRTAPAAKATRPVNTRRKGKLRAADQKVARASRELTGNLKLLLLDTAALDGPEHAFINAERQALRLGVTETYITKARSYLESVGLLKRHRRERDGRGGPRWSWEVLWRPEWTPTSDEPTDEGAGELAKKLDAFIRAAGQPAQTATSEPAQIAPSEVAQIATSLAPAPAASRARLPSPPFSEKVQQPLPSPPFSEKEKKAEKGTFVHEQKREGKIRDSRAGFPTPISAVVSTGIPAASHPGDGSGPTGSAPGQMQREPPATPEPAGDGPPSEETLTSWRRSLEPPSGALSTAPATSEDANDADLRTAGEIERARKWNRRT